LVWLVPVVIAINKFLLRPWVRANLEESALLILVNSLPNFIEALIGTVVLAGIGFVLRTRFSDKLANTTDRTIYAFATLLAGIYVITQEINLHSLGGNNVYDPYDLGASIIGLLFTFVVLNTYGLLADPRKLM